MKDVASKFLIVGLMIVLVMVVASTCKGVTWPISCGRFSAPITSPYGPRCRYGEGKFHAGIDIRITSSKKVVAVADGVVVLITSWSNYDLTLVIKHGYGENAWYSGYHHLEKIVDGLVEGSYVSEGQQVAIADSDHLHFNYWDKNFSPSTNDDNTLNPLRILGEEGIFAMHVCPIPGIAALRVEHRSQLVEVGVGVSLCYYCYPYYTYIWNYEGNVRTFTVTNGVFVPGNCYLGENSMEGVSPTDFIPYCGTETYFTFPAQENEYIYGDEFCTYTYALSANGSRICILEPIASFFSKIATNVSKTKVEVYWEVSGKRPDPSDFIIYKGTSTESMRIVDIGVSLVTATSFYFMDEDVEIGSTYYYRITWTDSGRTISSKLINVTIPGDNSTVMMSNPYPNPSSSSISVKFRVPVGKIFDLSVYDVSGRHIKTIKKGLSNGREIEIVWDGTSKQGKKVAKGVYFIRLAVNGNIPIMKKVLLLN